MSFKRQIFRFFLGPERGSLGKIDSRYLIGLRIAILGGLLAFVGAAIVALGVDSFGKIVVVTGILVGAAGLGYHFILMILWLTKGKARRR